MIFKVILMKEVLKMLKALGSKFNIEKSDKTKEYYGYIKDLLDNEQVNMMKEFRHHYSTTCFQHCLNVSYYNYLICRKLRLNSKKAARAGLLHDFFLYDRRKTTKKQGEKAHGFRHPAIALDNAKIHFNIDKREEDIILKHMWPLTLKMPRYAESYVIVCVDKYIAIIELSQFVIDKVKGKFRRKKLSYQV